MQRGLRRAAHLRLRCDRRRTFDKLLVTLYGSQGTNTNTVTVTVYKNRANTGMTCSVQNFTGTYVSCTDTTHTFSVVPGDAVALGYAQTDNVPVVRIGVGTHCQ